MPYYRVDRIAASRTALIVVDMQNDFVSDGAILGIGNPGELISKIAQMIDVARQRGIHVVYTTHVHRADGADLGLFRHNEALARGRALRAGSEGVAVHPSLAPSEGELVVAKHRFSGFYGTDLEMVLRGWGVDTVIISGATTENCCHATARDALFRDFRVVFLSDATATFDYDDTGQGSMSAAEVHQSILVILDGSTGHVMTVAECCERISD